MCSWYLIASLPMRNWNWFIMPEGSGLKPLPAYLWGIETPVNFPESLVNELLPAYLWGIETWEEIKSE